MTKTQYTFGEYSVCLGIHEDSPFGELDDLHICHLGMKFLSSRPLPEFSVYQFDMTIRPLDGTDFIELNCCGIVVSTEQEGDLFRTVIHFSDLDEASSSHLENITRTHNMRCECCANR